MIVECSHCQGPFETLPGYDALTCPHCSRVVEVKQLLAARGDSYGPTDGAKVPAAPSAVPQYAPGLPKAKKGIVIGCFHSRLAGLFGGSNLYRTYVTSEELIFIHLGIRHLDENMEAARHTAAMGGGAIPAFLTSVVMHKKRMFYWNLIKALEKASVTRLIEYASEDPDSFVLRFDEITFPRFDRPTLFGSITSGAHRAVLRLFHTQRGKLTVQIPELRDLRVAWPTLAAQFGEDLKVSFTWRDV